MRTNVRGLASTRPMVGAVIGALLLVAAGGGSATAAEAEDLLTAVAAATPETVSSAVDVPVQVTGESALSAATGGIDFVVPVRASKGIEMSGNDASIRIGLPFADQAKPAVAETNGIVSYDNSNGSSSVIVLTEDGSLQVNTVIDGPDAPTVFEHKLTLPKRATISLDGTGGAVILDSTGVVLMLVAAPWAKDAVGASIPTHYVVKGHSLLQVVEHRDANAVYPVVADPTYYGCALWGWYPGLCVQWTKAETKAAASFVYAAAPAATVAAYLCDKLPSIYRLACKVAGTTLIANQAYKITSAASQNKCLRYGFSYPPVVNIFTSLEIVSC